VPKDEKRGPGFSLGSGEIQIRGNKLTIKAFRGFAKTDKGGAEEVVEPDRHVTLRVDPTQKPKAIDFLVAGKEGQVRAVFEVKGDTLTICFLDGKERPKDLNTFSGKYIYKRKKS
jgi:uncharacterized protein (TIGR03067 family)